MKKLIACIDNPTANPPGHTIKEARPPYVPVAAISVFPEASPEVKREREALARAMAAAPDLLEALQGLVAMTEGKGQTDCWDKARAAITRATKG